MNIPRSQAMGIILVFFLLILVMWARYLRDIFP